MKPKNAELPYYAVIFSSQRTDKDHQHYEEMAEGMLKIVEEFDGYLGCESYRNLDGKGVTISYWQSLNEIQYWKDNLAHRAVQRMGRDKWYSSYTVRVCKIEKEYSFDAE
ncbi:MAG: antibiotic biosynthesis monooxygenase [Cyclobacteriaceae bacterium]|nr:antibiotic biosynthesis monooxygenase [Cyclobacteriaceae bacterium]